MVTGLDSQTRGPWVDPRLQKREKIVSVPNCFYNLVLPILTVAR